MMIYNKLALEALGVITNYFKRNNIDWYLTVINSTYLDNFKRQAMFCVAFYKGTDLYYMFFNGAYVDDTARGNKHAEFTSISLVSAADLNAGTYGPTIKMHISNTKDAKALTDYIDKL